MSAAEGNLKMLQYQAKHRMRFVALPNRQETAKKKEGKTKRVKQKSTSKRNGRPFANFREDAKRAKDVHIKGEYCGASDPYMRPNANGDIHQS